MITIFLLEFVFSLFRTFFNDQLTIVAEFRKLKSGGAVQHVTSW